MPIPPEALAAMQAQSGLFESGMNVLSQAYMNRQQQKWQLAMYGRQRKDALADWQMQNEYNHPSSVMARLREAKLNPNLIYGKGAGDMTSGAVRSSEAGSWNPKAPQFNISQGLGSAMSSYYDVQVKQAQIDNLRTQNTVLMEDAQLKEANRLATLVGIGKTEAETARSKFDLQLATELRQTSMQAAQANLEKTKAETDSLITNRETAIIMREPNLRKAIAEIVSLEKHTAKTQAEINEINERIKLIMMDQELKKWEIELADQGLNRTDPHYVRLAYMIARKWTGSNVRLGRIGKGAIGVHKK